jgi:hypothetical protein
MIPLGYFLIAWLVLVGLFCLLAFVTVVMQLRYGMSGTITFVSTTLFLVVSAAIILGMGWYLLMLDWSQEVQVIPGSTNVLQPYD